MLDITALQTQWKAVRTDYDSIDEQRRKKKEEPAKAEEPAQPRRGIEAGKLKGMDVPRSEPSQYEKQITDSQGIIADKYQRIGKLQQEIKRCTPDMRKRSPTLNRKHNSY